MFYKFDNFNEAVKTYRKLDKEGGSYAICYDTEDASFTVFEVFHYINGNCGPICFFRPSVVPSKYDFTFDCGFNDIGRYFNLEWSSVITKKRLMEHIEYLNEEYSKMLEEVDD